MLYCLHSNKKPTLFYKNKLSVLSKKAKQLVADKTLDQGTRNESIIDLGREMREYIFTEQQPDKYHSRIFDELASEWIVQFIHTDVERLYKNTCKIDKSFFPLKNEIAKFFKLKECDDKKISDFISKLVKLDTPMTDVARFVVKCIRHMLPDKFIGKANKEYLISQVSECVKMKKYEMLSFKEVYRRVNTCVT